MDDDTDVETDDTNNNNNNNKAPDPKTQFAAYVKSLRGVRLGMLLSKMEQTHPECLVSRNIAGNVNW